MKNLYFHSYKFTSNSWEILGDGIAKSSSLISLSLIHCGLNHFSNLEAFMKGLNENDSLEKVDLSDNDITDKEGLFIVRFIKQ